MRASRAILYSLVLVCTSAAAEDHAIGAKLGFLGVGVEYSYRLSDRITIRGGINGSDYSFNETESGIYYDFSLDFDSLSVGVDFHPTSGAFRLSGGLLQNDTVLRGIGISSGGTIDIGDDTYTGAEIGTLSGSIGFDSTAPYVGIGWDWLREKKVGMTFEMGLVDQGPPQVSLTATGPITSDPGFQADLAAEEAELRDSVDDLDLYPYASFGVVVRF